MIKLLDHFSLDMLRYSCSAKITLLNTQEAENKIKRLMKKNPIRLGVENKDLVDMFIEALNIPQPDAYANFYTLKKGDEAIVGIYRNGGIHWAHIKVS